MRGDILILFLAITLFASCNRTSFDHEEDLLAHIKNPENGYLQEKKVNGVDIALMYRPTDLLVNQELNGNHSEQLVDSLRKKYASYLYFNLHLSKNGKELLSAVPSDRNEFGALVNKLAFGMGESVHLYTNTKDTIAMADYIYPRMYGMSGSTSLLLVYPNNEKAKNADFLNFTIEDIGLATGEIKFKIYQETIANEPQLAFNPENE
ncbi:MAG: hypothetical protein Aureis2KO_18680 [Aureisphaera sp.]